LDRKDLTKLIRKFVFDVDGTITPSRKKIDDDFATFFESFCKRNLVYFVTGSDKPKTVEQIGEKIFNSAQLSFNCAGNEVWNKDYLVYSNDWRPHQAVIDYLEELLKESKFPEKAGNHIELRKGMVNFSIPGRKCTLEQREQYKLWDSEHTERKLIRDRILDMFDNIDVYIGGETGLDIFKKGEGKSRAIGNIRTNQDEKLYYFGDQIFPGGNDYDAAQLCDVIVSVESWTDTYRSLVSLEDKK
jgi:phosphomannomutase